MPVLAEPLSRTQAVEPFATIDYRMRFPALDGLRGLAVTLVFLEHYAGGAHGGAVLHLMNAARLRGWIGVDLFFVLSGFLITGILFDTQTDSLFFRRFFARRSLRVLPVLGLVTAALLALTPLLRYQWRAGHLLFLFYVGNFLANAVPSYYGVLSLAHPALDVTLSHLWSLCVEEQFYLLWPLAVWFLRDRRTLLGLAAGLCVLAPMLRLAFLLAVGPVRAESWIMRSLPFRMDPLLAGAVLALLLRGPAAAAWRRRGLPVCAAAGAATLALFLLSPAYDSPWLLTIGLSSVALAGAGLISASLDPGTIIFRLLSLPFLRSLGRVSYGFYVYHLLFRAAWIRLLVWLTVRVHSVAIAGSIALALNFAMTFLVAWLSFHLVEVRFLHLKRRFRYDEEPGALTAGPGCPV